MKNFAIGAIFLLSFAINTIAQADTFVTEWQLFSIDRSTGSITTYVPETEALVPMPQGYPWTCMKTKINKISGEDKNIVGFFCVSTEKVIVAVEANCHKNKEDTDSARAAITSSKFGKAKSVLLGVSCVTKKSP